MKYFIPNKLTALFAGCLLFSATTVSAQVNLKDIMGQAFMSDPTLEEAQANISMAESQTKVSQAGHYPIISVTGTQVLSQKHVYTSERRSGPGLAGRVNLFAWGGIEAEVERDKHKTTYYQHKLTETREIMGQEIAQLYLTALRAKETIRIYKESLQRHERTLKDLGVIASYDTGRYSEVNEALSRKNQVETTILMQERTMQSALNRLSRYSGKVLSPNDLVDPFSDVKNVKNFIATYRNDNIATNPSYLAQQAEFDSAKAGVDAAKARRLPAINLEGTANRQEHEVYLSLSWDIFNQANKYSEQQSYYSQKAAEAKLREIELNVREKSLTSESDMVRNQKLAAVANKQISLQRNVVADNELQFEIGMRSLIDLLNSYQELSRVQLDEISAINDFRDAALLYLVSQARITDWVGAENAVARSKKK